MIYMTELTKATWIQTLMISCVVLAGPIGGYLLDHYDPVYIFLPGILLAGTMLLVLSSLNGLPGMYAAAVFLGIGMSFAGINTNVLVQSFFTDYIGLATGITVSFKGIGDFCFCKSLPEIMLSVYDKDAYSFLNETLYTNLTQTEKDIIVSDWKETLRIHATLILCVGTIVCLMLVHPPHVSTSNAEVCPQGDSKPNVSSIWKAMKTRTMVCICAAYCLGWICI